MASGSGQPAVKPRGSTFTAASVADHSAPPATEANATPKVDVDLAPAAAQQALEAKPIATAAAYSSEYATAATSSHAALAPPAPLAGATAAPVSTLPEPAAALTSNITALAESSYHPTGNITSAFDAPQSDVDPDDDTDTDDEAEMAQLAGAYGGSQYASLAVRIARLTQSSPSLSLRQTSMKSNDGFLTGGSNYVEDVRAVRDTSNAVQNTSGADGNASNDKGLNGAVATLPSSSSPHFSLIPSKDAAAAPASSPGNAEPVNHNAAGLPATQMTPAAPPSTPLASSLTASLSALGRSLTDYLDPQICERMGNMQLFDWQRECLNLPGVLQGERGRSAFEFINEIAYLLP